jgi:hypothetical protein
MKSRTGSLLTVLTTAMALALLALGAFGSASASAAPPEISPAPTGSESVSFSGSAGETDFNNGLQIVKCATSSMSGEFTTSQEVKAKISFQKCEALSGTGLEQTELLKGKLGYINKATKEAGLLLEPASGEVFAKNFFAGANAVGGLIGETTPANSSKKA